MKKDLDTSWEQSAQWYDHAVGKKGHFYHQTVIIHALLKLLKLPKDSKLLDLGCGQGVIARALPKEVDYLGVDLSPTLIEEAKRRSSHRFMVADVSLPLKKVPCDFSHGCIVLALQNIESVDGVLQNLSYHLKPAGQAVIVLNHPCFRIPRQTSWGIDATKKLQYRRIDRYLSPLKIPIQTHPSQTSQSPTTWSFHRSLSDYSQSFLKAGFVIEEIQEWTSTKESMGKHRKMENFARTEFPLFLSFRLLKAHN